mgnify:CR=1 FL=1
MTRIPQHKRKVKEPLCQCGHTYFLHSFMPNGHCFWTPPRDLEELHLPVIGCECPEFQEEGVKP